jgi:heme oxygenase
MKPKDLKEAWNEFEEMLRSEGDSPEGIEEVRNVARAALKAGGELGDYWRWRIMEKIP